MQERKQQHHESEHPNKYHTRGKLKLPTCNMQRKPKIVTPHTHTHPRFVEGGLGADTITLPLNQTTRDCVHTRLRGHILDGGECRVVIREPTNAVSVGHPQLVQHNTRPHRTHEHASHTMDQPSRNADFLPCCWGQWSRHTGSRKWLNAGGHPWNRARHPNKALDSPRL